MSWQTVKLGEVLTHRKGFITISDSEKYKLCRVQLHRKGVLLREIVSGATIRTKKQQLCKANDFIVAEMDAKVGGYGFIPQELEGAIVSSHYYLFEVNENLLKKDFLAVLNKTQILQSQIKATGSTNYASVRPSDVLSWEIPLPTIEEQERIVESIQIVETNKNQISTELNHQLALVKELRQAYLREAMQGNLIEPDIRDEPVQALLKQNNSTSIKFDVRVFSELRLLLKVPSHWSIEPLAKVASAVVDCPHSTPKWTGQGKICVRTNQFRPGSLDLSDTRFVSEATYLERIERFEPTSGDILYSREGGILGVACRVPPDVQLCLGQRMMLIRAGLVIKSAFLEMVLNSPIITGIAEKRTIGGAAPRINVATVKAYPIPLPPLAEQERIVAKLERLMKFCDELEANIRQGITDADRLLQTALKEALEPK